MANIYDFYNRENELKELIGSFEDLINRKESRCFVVHGKKDIGKSRLIREFVNNIDVRLLAKIPGFSKERDLIEYQCEERDSKPYTAFVEITKAIYKRNKIINVLIKLMKIPLAIFGINDALQALTEFGASVVEEEGTEKLKKQEIKLFNQYKRFLNRRSNKAPLIIYIQNIQWIDIYSLKLIHALISDKHKFWGMIILEYDDLDMDQENVKELNKILKINNVNQIKLSSLDKSFPSRMLESRFGEDFFTSEENDILYTVSKGSPGKLEYYIEKNCVDNLLLRNGREWIKSDGFLESIKPVQQKLLELIIALYEDKELNDSELKLIKKMSRTWNVSQEELAFTVHTVIDIMDEGYTIDKILRPDISSSSSLIVQKDGADFIIDYIDKEEGTPEDKLDQRVLDSSNLYLYHETNVCTNGILLIWKKSEDPEEVVSTESNISGELSAINADDTVGKIPEPAYSHPSKKRRFSKIIGWSSAAIVIIALIIVVLLKFVPESHSKSNIVSQQDITDHFVIYIDTINTTKDSARIIKPVYLEYLLRDASLKSKRKPLLDKEQWIRMNSGMNHIPQKEIYCTIKNQEYSYELEVKILDNKEQDTLTKTFPFFDQSEILSPIANSVAMLVFDSDQKVEPITHIWDAYDNFIKGVEKWDALDIKALDFFGKALEKDPQLIQAKISMARVFNFNGEELTAKKLLKEANKSISKLNPVDSILTVAFDNTLQRNTLESIENYRVLKSLMPAQKEPFYELAEAYFAIREIDLAISNYKSALGIDPEFSRGINHLAYCYSHLGDHHEALNLFEKYVSLDSSANSFDSYGDGFFSAGMYDSARIYKREGLRIDPTLDYLHSSLCYINTISGKVGEAENNINKYLELQERPNRIGHGLTTRALIYYSIEEYDKALELCQEAESIFDSDSILGRNHEMHWLLGKLYCKLGQDSLAMNEINEMRDIIEKNEISGNNYNEVLKFCKDLELRDLCIEGDFAKIEEIFLLFDESIGDKIKDWSSPFDPAFFNTEFGVQLVEYKYYDLAEERFRKALDYNPNYPRANYYLHRILSYQGENEEAMKYKIRFLEVTANADEAFKDLFEI